MVNPFHILERFLFVLSELLFYPVILALSFLVFYMVYQGGIFLRLFLERKEGKDLYVNFFLERLNYLKEHYVQRAFLIELEALLTEIELKLLKRLDRVRVVVRLGPALGLLGTLIPMGVALSELAKGNLTVMAERMVTGFTTAIIGLSCGAISYLMSIIVERWNREILSKIYYLAEKEGLEVKKED
ncbi:MAG: MotA/TolQ/ExbB proton channel family protein [Caldimicrobium sp.]